jgi:hypothetical protein
MQKIHEFSAPATFLPKRKQTPELNEEIRRLNREGWRVLQVMPVTTFAGAIDRWVLLLDDDRGPSDLPVDQP